MLELVLSILDSCFTTFDAKLFEYAATLFPGNIVTFHRTFISNFCKLYLIQVIFPQLQKLCKENGKFLVLLESEGHGRKVNGGVDALLHILEETLHPSARIEANVPA